MAAATPSVPPLDPATAATASGPPPAQPILVLGGFLIGAEAYGPLVESLERLSGQRVVLLPVTRWEWLLTVLPLGWARLLDRVAIAAAELAGASQTGRITLVGHSSGGILLRLFLADGPFEGRCYGGRRLADTLITLGSPHTALKATAMRTRVARELPGAYFGHDPLHPVRYVAVAGVIELEAGAGQASATARRLAPTAYRNSSGDAADRGDGLVPVGSALLEGAEPVLLEGVAHGGAFGAQWYGTPAVVERWWAALA
ncbi:MAG: esterase/lipase family protein [Cyanobium sp.]